MWHTLNKWLDRLLATFATLFTLVYISSVAVQLFGRTFLPKAASWTEEVARYAFIYAVAAAGGLAARANSFVSVDILTNYIPKRLRRAYFIALDAFLCSFALFFLVKCAATDKFAFMKRRFVSTALEMPMQMFYFALVALFASLAFNYTLNIISLIKGEDIREAPPQ